MKTNNTTNLVVLVNQSIKYITVPA